MVTDCIKEPCKAEPEHVHSLYILNHQISCFPGSVIYVLKWSCWGRARGDTCPGTDPVRWNPAIPAFLSYPPQIFDHGTNAPSIAPWHRELCSEELPEDSQALGEYWKHNWDHYTFRSCLYIVRNQRWTGMHWSTLTRGWREIYTAECYKKTRMLARCEFLTLDYHFYNIVLGWLHIVR